MRGFIGRKPRSQAVCFERFPDPERICDLIEWLGRAP